MTAIAIDEFLFKENYVRLFLETQFTRDMFNKLRII